ncbi:LysR family transcriptional regulator [Cupriavidus plantarum]|uniref:LysR family transcriptional regulator n=2 Tax=Cupriavidus plantarum TaxID=942865 RepID=A0A316EPR5_9BURK|nr:LysR family transcriptional regulator [Cupriavidus plantarum]NYI01942.1 DNA-binding transcriptional LysR family regulator [Cupriavidus plantarum]PWK34075.1 LysR family transcriptional regulator [Cupriavidus plantarum]RLK31603.1 LysR family transcriptional regulator [Cupriavidus plantarum]CAG2147107.1 HTH-type transcriptional regulator PgrR [Cupriavidus plantarum]SMR85640.1 transcriptional regulator, LysR family [Cupriavidus plantarum]
MANDNKDIGGSHVETRWSLVYSLVVLGELGSYTAAAARLGLSKSALSQRIAELERAAGVALVRRTTRSMRLTEAGQQLADSTRASFEDIERSFAGVRDLVGEPRGLVRVTAPVALGRQQIVPRIPAFLKTCPDVRIELELSDRLSSLVQEGFDLAIRHTAAAPDTHVAWTLCRTHAVLVASREYLKRHGTPTSPEALADHVCLPYFRRGETPAWSFEPVRGGGARRNVPIRGSFSANNSEVLREAALQGLGIALLPDFSAQEELRAGRLIQVLPNWRSAGAFGNHLFAIRPYSPYVPLAVRAFVDYLRQALKDGFKTSK